MALNLESKSKRLQEIQKELLDFQMGSKAGEEYGNNLKSENLLENSFTKNQSVSQQITPKNQQKKIAENFKMFKNSSMIKGKKRLIRGGENNNVSSVTRAGTALKMSGASFTRSKQSGLYSPFDINRRSAAFQNNMSQRQEIGVDIRSQSGLEQQKPPNMTKLAHMV